MRRILISSIFIASTLVATQFGEVNPSEPHSIDELAEVAVEEPKVTQTGFTFAGIETTDSITIGNQTYEGNDEQILVYTLENKDGRSVFLIDQTNSNNRDLLGVHIKEKDKIRNRTREEVYEINRAISELRHEMFEEQTKYLPAP